MIRDLVRLSERLRLDKAMPYVDDALDTISVAVTCELNRDGAFRRFVVSADKRETIVEALTSKKGKARLLVDKAEEILGLGEKAASKHKLFKQKLDEYSNISSIAPVNNFYGRNKSKGVQSARKAFSKQVDENARSGNIAFKLVGETYWLHDAPEIHKAVIEKHKVNLEILKSARLPRCSVCGSSDYPVTDEFPHGMIKRVPAGQTSGCALVSYNEKPFESYHLGGNENGCICTHCARAYVDALNWLLRPSSWKPGKKGKDIPVFRNRKDIAEDTAVVFWLRDAVVPQDLDILENPDEGRVREMYRSVEAGRAAAVNQLKADKFYAMTLSGAAARIAIRDWIETSVEDVQQHLVAWFRDTAIGQYDPELKMCVERFLPFWSLVRSAKSKGGKDAQHARIGAALWRCAVLGVAPPLWMIGAVLNRIRAEQGNTTQERLSLLRLYLCRTTLYNGGVKYMSTLDDTNGNVAYVCGRLFAVFESAQYHASGGNLNAGIRERFFSFASTMPATAFGRLMKLTQHHLSKIRGEKPGLAINLDKKMQDLVCRIGEAQLPAIFPLEDQASFALGYYHQRQHDFSAKSNNKEN